MTLQYILLSELAKKEATGYDLSNKFKGFSGAYWTASHQQIYRVLALLEEDGFVKSKKIPQRGKPDKNLFTITEEGLAHIEQWIPVKVKLPVTRDALLSKLMASSEEDIPAVKSVFEAYRDNLQEKLSKHARSFLDEKKETKGSFDSLKDSMAYQRTSSKLLEEINWVTDCINKLTIFEEKAYPQFTGIK